MPRPKHLSKSAFGANVANYLNIAYKDYLGARVLLQAGLLPQGAVLASTAVEKYFKAILAFRGNEARGHLSERHINSAKNFDKRISAVLSDSILSLLQHAYKLRYLDDLPPDYNLVIAHREFLAELDHTAITMQESFKMKLNGQEAQFTYHVDKAKSDPILLTDNHVLLNQKKQDFISAEPQAVYEVRNCTARGFMEISYVCTARVSDGNFLRAGFAPTTEARAQYQLALFPLYDPKKSP